MDHDRQETLGADFWRFFGGQTVSNLGSSITLFVLPLLVYELTGSALNLGITTAAAFLPYALFGLAIGAWVDRLDRKRLMIAVDLGRAVVIAAVPVLAWLDRLPVEAVYVAAFLISTLTIAFDCAQFAAIPSLVGQRDLVTANGRIQASFAAATIAGPPLAGLLAGVVALETVLVFDAGSFVVSAASLSLIRRHFNQPRGETTVGRQNIRRDVIEGLRYVLGHPVLRSISLMMALINFFGSTTNAQLVLFAKERFNAGDGRISLLFSAGGIGAIVLSLAAGPLRRRLPFAPVALGALLLSGALTVAFAMTPYYWVALALQGVVVGLGTLFNINTGSLRQQIVPNHLLGRVLSVAGVLAWSAIPLGTLAGGWAIERTGDVQLVYAVIGGLMGLLAVGFWALSPLGHAEDFLPKVEPTVPSSHDAAAGEGDDKPRLEAVTAS
jgi:MFS family permease